jgi:hypothetical protein
VQNWEYTDAPFFHFFSYKPPLITSPELFIKTTDTFIYSSLTEPTELIFMNKLFNAKPLNYVKNAFS